MLCSLNYLCLNTTSQNLFDGFLLPLPNEFNKGLSHHLVLDRPSSVAVSLRNDV